MQCPGSTGSCWQRQCLIEDQEEDYQNAIFQCLHHQFIASAGFTLDTYTHITNDMQRGAAEKIGGFMETATAKPEPEPPDPPEENRCKVIPFERVG